MSSKQHKGGAVGLSAALETAGPTGRRASSGRRERPGVRGDGAADRASERREVRPASERASEGWHSGTLARPSLGS